MCAEGVKSSVDALDHCAAGANAARGPGGSNGNGLISLEERDVFCVVVHVAGLLCIYNHAVAVTVAGTGVK